MKCTKCGDENTADATFCASCGATLSETPTPIHHGGGVTPVPPVTPVTPVSEPVSSGMKTGILIGSIVVPLLGIIMGAIYMNDPSPAKKEVGKLWLMVGIGAFVLWCVVSASLQSAVT
jgi:hypothetical protein